MTVNFNSYDHLAPLLLARQLYTLSCDKFLWSKNLSWTEDLRKDTCRHKKMKNYHNILKSW